MLTERDGSFRRLVETVKEQQAAPSNNNKGKRGLYAYSAPSITGPFKPNKDQGLVMQYEDRIYDVSIIEKIDNNEWLAMGFLNNDKDGYFIGRLSEPFILRNLV